MAPGRPSSPAGRGLPRAAWRNDSSSRPFPLWGLALETMMPSGLIAWADGNNPVRDTGNIGAAPGRRVAHPLLQYTSTRNTSHSGYSRSEYPHPPDGGLVPISQETRGAAISVGMRALVSRHAAGTPHAVSQHVSSSGRLPPFALSDRRRCGVGAALSNQENPVGTRTWRILLSGGFIWVTPADNTCHSVMHEIGALDVG